MDTDTKRQIEELLSRIRERNAAIERDAYRIQQIVEKIQEPSDESYVPFQAYRSWVPRRGFVWLLIAIATIAVLFTLFSAILCTFRLRRSAIL